MNVNTMMCDSSTTSFLQRSLAYDNYFLYPWTMGKKIVFDSSNTARGVVVNTAGAGYLVGARKEIILSAGVSGLPPKPRLSSTATPPVCRPSRWRVCSRGRSSPNPYAESCYPKPVELPLPPIQTTGPSWSTYP